MSDLVKRLRGPLPTIGGYAGNYINEDAVIEDCFEAADRIEALEAELERLREFFDAFEERVAAYMEGTNEARISLSQKRFREAQDAVRADLNAKEEG